MNEKNKLDSKYLIFLALLYMAIMCAAHTLTNKLVDIDGLLISGGTFLVPITFTISDIIAEVYGYDTAKNIIWLTMICVFIFAIAVNLITRLPAPLFWHNQAAYEVVLYPIFRVVIATIIGTIIGSFLNVYLITKWKVLLKGKYFWLRSLGASMIGEAIFVIITGVIAFSFKYSWGEIISLMFASYSIKVLFNIISVWPANIIAIILKRKDDVYDHQTDFNPFKLDSAE